MDFDIYPPKQMTQRYSWIIAAVGAKNQILQNNWRNEIAESLLQLALKTKSSKTTDATI
jgi:hypothetical protein